MPWDRRPFEPLHRIAVLSAEDRVGDQHSEMGRKLGPMAGVTHGVPDAVMRACAREPVLGYVDEPAPAIVDLDTGELREDLREACL